MKLALGDGVVDGRHLQDPLGHHLVSVVDPGGGLLGDALDTWQELWILGLDAVGKVPTIIQNHVEVHGFEVQ